MSCLYCEKSNKVWEKNKGLECTNGDAIIKGHKIIFDTSYGEYSKGAINIDYCPKCGQKLEETE